MGKAVTALVLVLLLAAVVVGGFAVWTLSPAQQDAARQQTAIQAARAAQDLRVSQDNAAWWKDFRDAMTPLLLLVLGVLAGCAIVGVCGAVAIWLAMKWDERRKQAAVYHPDARGLLPVTPYALDQAATLALGGHHQAAIEAARRPTFSGQARNERLTIKIGRASCRERV